MINTVFATKQSMRETFNEEGKRLAVTSLALPEHRLTKLATPEKEGYFSVQLGIGRKKKAANKPMGGHLAKAKLDYQPRYLREVRLSEADETLTNVGDALDLSTIVGKGDTITITSVSKGKGFAGVVKRHGFHGGPKTHGQSDRHRAPGSIGQRTTPGRIYKGKKMAGRMGSDTITVQNLKVLGFDAAQGELLVSGPVPGYRGSLVKIQVIKKAPAAPVAEVVETAEVAPEATA